MVYRFGAPLYFANAGLFEEQIGQDRMYPTNRHAVVAYCREQGETESESGTLTGETDQE